MAKSDMTTKRPKEPFDPALDAPISLTPDQLEKVIGGLASPATSALAGLVVRGGTMGIIQPLPKDEFIWV